MQEIIAGFITVIDVVALFLLLPIVKKRFLLALWTGSLHMFFPLIGFQLGSWAMLYFLDWAKVLSSILLFLVGLQILLSAKKRQVPSIPPALLAITASIDTFSVSVSFGMLNLNTYLFVVSAGLGAFFLSYLSLLIAKKTRAYNGRILNVIAGVALITISIIAVFR